MAGSSQEVNQKACEIEKVNLREEQSPNEKLSKILKQMMLEAVREMKATFKAERKNKALAGNALDTKVFVSIQRPEDADLSPTNGTKQAGRKIKNDVVAEKVVCFTLPENIDAQNIKDIDKVKERLGKWRIQRRQRDSRMSDAYYCHLRSRQTFRSIPEAVSFMTCEVGANPTRKKSKGGTETSDSESLGKKARKDEEVEDFSYESVENWMYPNVEKSSTDEALNFEQGMATEKLGNAHLEGIDDDIEVIKNNVERYIDQLPDLTMDWKAGESILDTFYI